MASELAERFGVDAAAKVLAGEVVCADGTIVDDATVLPPGAHVYLYRDLPDEEPFDKIASVGMFEHVGKKNLPAYFGKLFRLLRPGGLLVFEFGMGQDVEVEQFLDASPDLEREDVLRDLEGIARTAVARRR